MPYGPAVANHQELCWNMITLNVLVALDTVVADYGAIAALPSLDEPQEKHSVDIDPHLVGSRVPGFRPDNVDPTPEPLVHVDHVRIDVQGVESPHDRRHRRGVDIRGEKQKW